MTRFKLKDISWGSGFDSANPVPGAVTLAIGYEGTEFEDYFTALHCGPNSLSQLFGLRTVAFGYGCLFTDIIDQNEAEELLEIAIGQIPCTGSWETDVLRLGALGRWEDDPQPDRYRDDEPWAAEGNPGPSHYLPGYEVREQGVEVASELDLLVGIENEFFSTRLSIPIISTDQMFRMIGKRRLVLGAGLLLSRGSGPVDKQAVASLIEFVSAQGGKSDNLVKLSRFGRVSSQWDWFQPRG